MAKEDRKKRARVSFWSGGNFYSQMTQRYLRPDWTIVKQTFIGKLDRLRFPYFGIHVHKGRMGSGKSTSATKNVIKAAYYSDRVLVVSCAVVNIVPMLEWRFRKLRKRNPAKFLETLERETQKWEHRFYKFNDLDEFIDLFVKLRNELYGIVYYFDEMHSWLSSYEQVKDIPREVLKTISQLRKQRKLVIGTSQIWGAVMKFARLQALTVIDCKTYLGMFTRMYFYHADCKTDDQTGEIIDDPIAIKSFWHTPELRLAFDTFEEVNITQSLKDWRQQRKAKVF